jgi:DNA-binding Lrp family transcriptional regulator
MQTLDKFDVAILKELQTQARLANDELGSRIGLSAAPCVKLRKVLWTGFTQRCSMIHD